MIAIVCGGRTFANRDVLFEVLDAIDPDLVIEGGAHGADALAMDWAKSREKAHRGFRADWATYGKAAGPMRNADMLTANPDVVIAFPGGRGTANMIKQAKEKGVTVNRVRIQWALEEI